MAEGFIQVNEGTGKKLHANDRTIGADLVHDEYTLTGEYAYASYRLVATAISTATINSHLLQIMAGASLNVRIRRIRISQRASAGANTLCSFQLVRLTTAGTGGGAITAAKMDTADAASGATGMTLPTVKGTESTIVFDESRTLILAAATFIPTYPLIEFTRPDPGIKSLIIPAGAANGLAIKNTAAVATATVDLSIDFIETNFV